MDPEPLATYRARSRFIVAAAIRPVRARAGTSAAAGLRAGLPLAAVGFLFSFAFGSAARPVIGAPAAIIMSVTVFAGASQFAALTVLAAGGHALAAIAAATLLNLRFVPMGIAIAPAMSHRPLGRVARAQAIIDTSWALARRPGGDGEFEIDRMVGATLVQYATWVGGTLAGVLLGPVLGDTGALGLDIVFPAFMLALLAAELRRPRAALVAAAGVAITLVLTPLLPPGVPILAAGFAVLIALLP
jgi:predicted branched-subunit amino acid permease